MNGKRWKQEDAMELALLAVTENGGKEMKPTEA
jgi:hypothetical protein